MKKDQAFEKQLINFDEFQFKRQVDDFEKNRDILNKIVELYEGLFTGKITHERAGQVLVGNYSAIKEVAILEVAKSVKNQMLAEVAIQRTEERLTEFEAEASKLVYQFNQTGLKQPYPTFTPLDRFEINSDGRFFIPEETVAKIKELCSNYISTPEEKELHEALQQVGKGYTRFKASWGQYTRDHLSDYTPIETFLSEENGIVIPRTDIDYSQLAR